MLDIFLVGVVHHYQRPSPWKGQGQLEETQRQLYSAWIAGYLAEFRPELIADEMNLAEDDYRFKDTGAPWMYMDIPENVRKKYGLSKSPRPPGQEYIPEIDDPREEYWICVVEKVAAVCKISKVMVLCGAAHLKSFGDKLRARGHHVDSHDQTKEEWYDGSWFRGPLRP